VAVPPIPAATLAPVLRTHMHTYI